MKNIKISVLDQSQVARNSTAAQALADSGKLVQLADELGFERYWVSEHHNFKLVAGTAPEVLIPYLASRSERIRVGSGGIMLPNHSTLKMSENFGLLSTLFPGRIDFGIGRAPGGDRLSAHLLNPSNTFSEKDFFQQLKDVQTYLGGDGTEASEGRVKAYPAPEILPEFWILTSSGGSAQFAAHFGMALSFAHFINPFGGPEVAAIYRDSFKPSAALQEPKVNVGIFAFCSEDDQKVEDWITEFDYRMLHIEMGATGDLPSLEEIKAMDYSMQQRARIAYNRNRFIAGSPKYVHKKLSQLAEDYNIDEIMIATWADDFADRKRSYELIAEMFATK
ncbi:LLM class flavin-dependent oxidoreductase [Flavobacterium sp. MFBS3-15]|uniref:LLM class flavin-dependent oxidoreductase n=1 Tax=Flavobacterium sp. MFBS3-15 TaxID=2989816 RepID=UPI0022365187|nr:LLM class flavin-dependent oxidoreductase [Flavobacterium sp. MFBS3-15]MCW4467930.1 LLM class flavin-dependent oxidoreductase [Flavobacterium sp. MFBS3-15]